MGTSGYQMQSIGIKDGYRTERYSGGPRFGKYDMYSSLNVENFVFKKNVKNPPSTWEYGPPNLFFGGHLHGLSAHIDTQSTSVSTVKIQQFADNKLKNGSEKSLNIN